MVFVKLDTLRRIENFLQVLVNVFHYQKHVAELFNLVGGNDIEQLGGEDVVLHGRELPQNLDFAYDFLGLVFILKEVL